MITRGDIEFAVFGILLIFWIVWFAWSLVEYEDGRDGFEPPIGWTTILVAITLGVGFFFYLG